VDAPAPSFDRLSVVAFAPGWIVEDMRKIRARCAKSGVPVMDAHVTVKGGLVVPADLGALKAKIARAVHGYPPFTVRTMDPQVLERGGKADVILPLEDSPQLVRLHDLLSVLGGESRPYQPHVTVVEQISLDGVERTVRAIVGWRVNYFWTIRDVDLVGLERGQLWRSIKRFDFGKPV
jgi:2'-5' RNA ligase